MRHRFSETVYTSHTTSTYNNCVCGIFSSKCETALCDIIHTIYPYVCEYRRKSRIMYRIYNFYIHIRVFLAGASCMRISATYHGIVSQDSSPYEICGFPWKKKLNFRVVSGCQSSYVQSEKLFVRICVNMSFTCEHENGTIYLYWTKNWHHFWEWVISCYMLVHGIMLK